jgi:hypothetical protein
MTRSANNGFPEDARSAAAIYLAKCLAPIPLPIRSKNPDYLNWTSLRLQLETLDQYFPPGEARNVGVLNGQPSQNHVDVDLDCEEARRVGRLLLPKTGWIFGRKTAAYSHWIFKTDVALDVAQVEHKDLDGAMLLELRGSGGMTVYPPSLHRDTGERIAWLSFTEPAQVKLAELERSVRRVAAATLLARHWPTRGTRDQAAMALTGGLLRTGWNEDEVSRFVEAMAVAADDEELRARASKAKRTGARQADDKATTGWPTLVEHLGDAGAEVVKRVQDWLREEPPVEPPLPAERRWPDPLAQEAFFGLAGRIVHTIGPSTEADPAALLVQALIMFGNVIGRSSHFRVEGDCHYGNENSVLVGRTSKARKGTSFGRIARLFEEVDSQWFNERVASGISSGEGLIWAVRDPIMKRERVKGGGGVRYQEVEADPGIADKRLLTYEPEFCTVLKQTERTGNTASAILRQAWDGCKVLRALTKNSPARSTSAHISVVGHITPEELQRYLSQTESANGFANRFLFVCTERSKLLPEGGHVDALAWEALRSDLAQALAFAVSTGEIKRDDDARTIWCQVYGTLSEGKPGLAGALLARAEAHVMRLALLYALLDKSSCIQAPHLLAALALWDYCERSVRFIFGDSLGDDVADELLRLLRGCLPNGMTRSDISNYFQRHASSNRIGKALGLLLQNKLVRREDQQTGGRPSERWFAVGP